MEKLAEAGTPRAQLAPGMLKKHYSPRAVVRLFDFGGNPPDVSSAAGTAAAVFQSRETAEKFRAAGEGTPRVFWLSETGELADVARAVFSLLRELDAAGFAEIFIEKSPDFGVGVAVNDRLSRAAAK